MGKGHLVHSIILSARLGLPHIGHLRSLAVIVLLGVFSIAPSARSALPRYMTPDTCHRGIKTGRIVGILRLRGGLAQASETQMAFAPEEAVASLIDAAKNASESDTGVCWGEFHCTDLDHPMMKGGSLCLAPQGSVVKLRG